MVDGSASAPLSDLLLQIARLRSADTRGVSISEFRAVLRQTDSGCWSDDDLSTIYRRLRSSVRTDRTLRDIVDRRRLRLEEARSAARPESRTPVTTGSPRGAPWYSSPGEHYWLEITDRHDIGASLTHDRFDKAGHRMQSFVLAAAASPGDIVYHFDKVADAIVARSSVASRRTVHDDLDGVCRWEVALADVSPAGPVSFHDFERQADELSAIAGGLRRLSAPPHYLPFVTVAGRLNLRQTYLTRFPSAIVALFPLLAE